MDNIVNSNFIKKHLIDGEEVIGVYKHPRRIFLAAYLSAPFFFIIGLSLLFTIPSAVSGFFVLLGEILLLWSLVLVISAEIRLRCNHFIITNKKVMRVFNFISRNYVDLRFEDIRNIYYKQSIINRIFNVGTVYMSTAGTGGLELKIGPIVKYIEFFNEVDFRRGKESKTSD